MKSWRDGPKSKLNIILLWIMTVMNLQSWIYSIVNKISPEYFNIAHHFKSFIDISTYKWICLTCQLVTFSSWLVPHRMNIMWSWKLTMVSQFIFFLLCLKLKEQNSNIKPFSWFYCIHAMRTITKKNCQLK